MGVFPASLHGSYGTFGRQNYMSVIVWEEIFHRIHVFSCMCCDAVYSGRLVGKFVREKLYTYSGEK